MAAGVEVRGGGAELARCSGIEVLLRLPSCEHSRKIPACFLKMKSIASREMDGGDASADRRA